MNPEKKDDLKEVEGQYADLPYPPRNPADEKDRLLRSGGDYLGEINHWLFQGKEDFESGFRVLIAGAGTGDGVMYLADQLRETNAEIYYLDFSLPSMQIAQARATVRGLKNITWIHDSILNIPNLQLGLFDFIHCTGVLHHLSDPDVGLQILSDSLSDKGGMHLMVYAEYGRTGVYQMQDLLTRVNKETTTREEELKNAWTIMNRLPPTNWYKRGQDLMCGGGLQKLGDHLVFGDPGMYDMFLHKQDRAYTIPQLYEFVQKAHLNFVEFNNIQNRIVLNIENHIEDVELLSHIKTFSVVEQQAICELLYGTVVMHDFCVSKRADSVANFADFDNVPYFFSVAGAPEKISGFLKNNDDACGRQMTFAWESPQMGETTALIPVSEYTQPFFTAMIDPNASLKDIQDFISLQLGRPVSDQDFLNEVLRVLPMFETAGALLLRKKGITVAPYTNTARQREVFNNS